jgi:hypothetical protein
MSIESFSSFQLSSSSLGSTWRDKTLRLKSSWLLSHSMAASPLRGDALEKKYN